MRPIAVDSRIMDSTNAISAGPYASGTSNKRSENDSIDGSPAYHARRRRLLQRGFLTHKEPPQPYVGAATRITLRQKRRKRAAAALANQANSEDDASDRETYYDGLEVSEDDENVEKTFEVRFMQLRLDPTVSTLVHALGAQPMEPRRIRQFLDLLDHMAFHEAPLLLLDVKGQGTVFVGELRVAKQYVINNVETYCNAVQALHAALTNPEHHNGVVTEKHVAVTMKCWREFFEAVAKLEVAVPRETERIWLNYGTTVFLPPYHAAQKPNTATDVAAATWLHDSTSEDSMPTQVVHGWQASKSDDSTPPPPPTPPQVGEARQDAT